MAGASVTMTGLAELKAGVTRLPVAVTSALRAVAFRTSRTIYAGVKSRWEASLHGTGETVRHLAVTEMADKQLFEVAVGPMPGRPANLPLWLERGTVKMAARPAFRPAIEAVSDTYIRESDEAVTKAANEVLG